MKSRPCPKCSRNLYFDFTTRTWKHLPAQNGIGAGNITCVYHLKVRSPTARFSVNYERILGKEEAKRRKLI
jgi:hypothetical protein